MFCCRRSLCQTKHLGESSSFPRAMPTGNRTTWSRSIWTTPTPNQRQKDGTLVLSSAWPSQTPGNQQSKPLPVSLLSQPKPPRLTADAHHRFVAEECDWGFTRFVDLRKLYTPDPANGKNRPTIENDEVEITAFVRVLKDPTGVLWHNFVK